MRRRHEDITQSDTAAPMLQAASRALLHCHAARWQKKAPPIWLIRQHNKRYRYRIFDGAHRVRAAKLDGRKAIEARIALDECQGGVQ